MIRREFDIGEGDPYNHAMVEQGERRLNRLGYFKKVHISTRPGSTPDRVIVTVEVEDQPTGSVSLSGGYSTTAGFLAEVAFTETNFLGRGQYVKAERVGRPVQPRMGRCRSPSPISSTSGSPPGSTSTTRSRTPTPGRPITTWTTGANLRLGVPITDEFTFQPNYSIYQSQIKIPSQYEAQPYDDCTVGWGRRTDPGSHSPDAIRADVDDAAHVDRQLLDQRRSVGGVQGGGGARRDPDLGCSAIR